MGEAFTTTRQPKITGLDQTGLDQTGPWPIIKDDKKDVYPQQLLPDRTAEHFDPFIQWEAYLRDDCSLDTVEIGSITVGRGERPNVLPWISLRTLPKQPMYKVGGLEGKSRNQIISNWSEKCFDPYFMLQMPMPDLYMQWCKHIAVDSTGIGLTHQYVAIFEVEVRLLQDILKTISAMGGTKFAWIGDILIEGIIEALGKYRHYVFMSKRHYNAMVWMLQYTVRDIPALKVNVHRFLNLRSYATPFEFQAVTPRELRKHTTVDSFLNK